MNSRWFLMVDLPIALCSSCILAYFEYVYCILSLQYWRKPPLMSEDLCIFRIANLQNWRMI